MFEFHRGFAALGEGLGEGETVRCRGGCGKGWGGREGEPSSLTRIEGVLEREMADLAGETLALAPVGVPLDGVVESEPPVVLALEETEAEPMRCRSR